MQTGGILQLSLCTAPLSGGLEMTLTNIKLSFHSFIQFSFLIEYNECLPTISFANNTKNGVNLVLIHSAFHLFMPCVIQIREENRRFIPESGTKWHQDGYFDLIRKV